MASDFFDRIDMLAEEVGHGTLEGTVEVDQVYAFNVHEGHWLNFMGRYGPKTLRQHTGEGHFLQTPALARATEELEHLARAVLGGNLVHAMVDNMEGLSDAAAAITPVEFGDLAESGHPTVTDDGLVVYDRPPKVQRLSEAELEAKARLRHAARKVRHYLGSHHAAAGTLHETLGGQPVAKPEPVTAPTPARHGTRARS